MTNKRLYEIAGDLLDVLSVIEDEEGELTEDLEARLNAVQMDLKAKIEGILSFRQDLLGTAEMLKGEATRLQERASRFSAKAERLREYVRQTLEDVDIKKLEMDLFTAWRQKSAPKVVIDNEGWIAPKYRIGLIEKPWGALTEKEKEEAKCRIDKAFIKDDLKSGLPVTGAHLEQGEHLRVK